jgi:hypothetical protein
MRTHAAAALLAALLLPLASPRAAAAQEDSWWTQRMTFGEGPALVENLWMKGRRMRAETVVEGHTIVTLVDERRYVIIDVLGGTGISIARSPAAIAQDAKRKRPFGTEADDLLGKGAEKVGSEVRAGQEVDHYRHTDQAGNRSEVWVSQDELRLPLESRYRDRQTGILIRKVYLRWVQAAFPDSLFQPPPGVKLEEIGYEDYVKRSRQGPVGPAPPFYSDLLHGHRE